MRTQEPTPEMAFAIHPPIHVVAHPDERIRTIGAAVAFIKRNPKAAAGRDGRTDVGQPGAKPGPAPRPVTARRGEAWQRQ
jgi:hypothetical protein